MISKFNYVWLIATDESGLGLWGNIIHDKMRTFRTASETPLSSSDALALNISKAATWMTLFMALSSVAALTVERTGAAKAETLNQARLHYVYY